MSRILRYSLTSILALSLLAGSSACGSASNNDQGTSFLAFGYFADSTGTIGQTAAQVPLFADSAAQTNLGATGTQGNTTLTGVAADGNLVITYMGLQNRLDNQFIRLDRVECSYTIPGSSLVIPDDSFNSSVVLAPTQDQSGVLAQISYFGFYILSTDIIAYINNNQALLPQLPFRMNISCRGVGITQSGDVLSTNPLLYEIVFLDIQECCTGGIAGDPGFTTGAGTGGTINFSENTGGGTASLETAELADGDDSVASDDFVIE